jgi:acyl-CoA synthetase (AMP-forming)/AMP-acid ligase II
MTERFDTVLDRLAWRARHRADRWAFALLRDGEIEERRITYGELDRRARTVAAALREVAVPGDRALLLYPPGLDFIIGFFGCLYAGVLAVPMYPPDPLRLARTLERLGAITSDARPSVVLGPHALLEQLTPLRPGMPALAEAQRIATDTLDDTAPAVHRLPSADDVAFLQYTSGSTSTPKGVIVTHRNIAANAALFSEAYGMTEDSTVVSWLPLYHDMGLVGCVLAAVHTGYPSVLMSPLAFARRPVRWLRAITTYRATTSVAPDFAYALCARRIREDERTGLDLRTWQTAINGAEPVRADSLDAFATAFHSVGFDRRAFAPSFGLAETTLYVTGGHAPYREPRRTPICIEVDQRTLVGCGRVGDGDRVVIADPDTHTRCRDGIVGEIWVTGESVARGYWNRDDETRAVFGIHLAGAAESGRRYLRTGDLGFIRDGELFISGRAKDVIVVRGLCHYPQDIERTAERAHPFLGLGACAAFPIEQGGEEQVGLAIEVARRGENDPPWQSIRSAIRMAINEHHELAVAAIWLVRPGTLPKTSSGKIQRRACRDAILRGELKEVDTPTTAHVTADRSAS